MSVQRTQVAKSQLLIGHTDVQSQLSIGLQVSLQGDAFLASPLGST